MLCKAYSCLYYVETVELGCKKKKKRMSSTRRAPLLDEAKQLIDGKDVFLFDCDGVIWVGSELVAGVGEVLQNLIALGKRVLFVTNNSTKSRKAYVRRFADLGLDFVAPQQIYSSSWATAAHLKSLNFGGKVYVVGEIGIREELECVGIASLGADLDNERDGGVFARDEWVADEDVGAVVVGYDRQINFYKLAAAQQYLARGGEQCLLLATNPDSTFPVRAGERLPGAGTMVAAVERCSGRQATVIGKPSSLIVDLLMAEHGIDDASRVLMVGDRLNTDIAFGNNAGADTLLVLTGISTLTDLDTSDVQPAHYTPSIVDLLDATKQLLGSQS
jgi:phosphoglycolate phosphatase